MDKTEIRKTRLHNYDALELYHSQSGAFVRLVPELGGMVHALALAAQPPSPPKEAVEILKSDTATELGQNPWFRGRILFPFNDRIPQGRYSFRGQHYQLPVNDTQSGDALHGFLYRTSMALTDRHEGHDTASVTLSGQLPAQPGYPFCPSLTLLYSLRPSSFRLDFVVANETSQDLPFSLGWHPYFCLKQDPCRLDEHTLTLPAQEVVAVDNNLLPTGQYLQVEGTPYDYRAPTSLKEKNLDIAFINRAGWAQLQYQNWLLLLEMDKKMFPYTQVFVPPQRDGIALEPVSAATNAFNRPELGLQILEAGAKRQGFVQLSLSHK